MTEEIQPVKDNAVHSAIDITQLENGYIIAFKKLGNKTRIVADTLIYTYRTKTEVIKAIEKEL
jgi:hypothetical protein